ncbi:MAG: SGNH/GDSL hydrolase family protein [Myxococcales bacterium]|nr:SGNH/GDSL hydrolase family protein [Myxococcales bacterium]MCB9715193.1 SGNH/GDSL hydrolase family protein [Myxococcales bacterium]
MTYVRPTLVSPALPARCLLLALTAVLGCSDDASGDGTEGGSGTEGTGGGTAMVDGTGSDGAMTSSASGSATDGEDTTAGEDESSGDTGEPGGVPCLDEQFASGHSPGPDYSEFDVELGSHCQGTNQQDILGVERVVFVGDSVTVGTPPTGAMAFYRSILANELADLFGLMPPDILWEQVDPFSGTSISQESGDFASCAVWGARNDDLASQLQDCFSPEDYDLRTLVVWTMGGNDVSAIVQDSIAGAPLADSLMQLEEMVANHEAAVQWLTDPATFPNGAFVVNANVYEFTDYTVDLLSCPAADLAGFSSNPESPEVLLGSLNLINEEYMRIAQENGTDVVFMFEAFCGHGFHSGDETTACYRGPGNDNWFDLTCIHPTPEGHSQIADMFLSVISE